MTITTAGELPSKTNLPVYHPLAAAFWGAAARPRFRGEIFDFERAVELGSGYKVPDTNLCRHCRALGKTSCRHFEIDTIRQLEGPFRAIKDPNVRMVLVLGAVQGGKSLLYERSLRWLILESNYRNIIVYLDSEEKVKDFAKSRMMPTLKADPDIVKILPTGADRHGDTDTSIYFTNGKILHVRPLNERATSSLTWEVVIIDEGWLHGSDGMMQRAIDRAKQVPNRKIIIVGQAGNKDEDQDKIWHSLNKHVPITFACPCCGGRQEFNLTKARPAEFKPLPTVELFGREPWLPPAPGSFWGLKVQKRFSDIKSELEIRAVAQTVVCECYHCGFEIPDTPEFRHKLMATYQQDYQEEANGVKYTPENFAVGFWNPDPASVTVPLADTMQAYIAARIAKDRYENGLPLQEFYKNRWATAWTERMNEKPIRILSGANADLKELVCIVMSVDCQQGDVPGKTGKFWVEVRGVDAAKSKIIQLWRGYCDSWQEWWDIQAKFQIENENVAIDGANYTEEILDAAASRHKFVWRDGKQESSCWKILRGDGKRGAFAWEKRQPRAFSRPEWYRRRIPYGKDQEAIIKIPVISWSNRTVKNQFFRLLTGGPNLPQWHALKKEELPAKQQDIERGDLAYEKQVGENHHWGLLRNVEQWIEDSKNVHYVDTGCQCLVMFDMGGHLGLPAVADAVETAQ